MHFQSSTEVILRARETNAVSVKQINLCRINKSWSFSVPFNIICQTQGAQGSPHTLFATAKFILLPIGMAIILVLIITCWDMHSGEASFPQPLQILFHSVFVVFCTSFNMKYTNHNKTTGTNLTRTILGAKQYDKP